MKVTMIRPQGYCKGVVKAIQTAILTKQNNPHTPIYIYGHIVHNKLVNQALNNLGIITLLPNEEELNKIKDGIIILTAHGTPKSIVKQITDLGLKIVDTTCLDVAKSFSTLEEAVKSGDVIYLGKLGHPESLAALSLSPNIHLISSLSDIDHLPNFTYPLYFSNQTTMSIFELAEFYAKLKDKYPQIIILNEQCNATTTRQKAIIEAKDDFDLIIIVGDLKSNNSFKLLELSRKKCPAYLIEELDQLDISWLQGKSHVGLTSGASTPVYLTKMVFDFISKFDETKPSTQQKAPLELNLVLKEFI